MKLKKIYSRPNITSEDVLSLEKPRLYVEQNNLSKDIIEQVEIQVKYSGYIEKEKSNAEKLQNLENISIPAKFNYCKAGLMWCFSHYCTITKWDAVGFW